MWKPLSYHFKQTYEEAYRYLDNCGAFMVDVRKQFNALPTDPTPAGAKLEIPDYGISIGVDTKVLAVTQELNHDSEKFIEVCKALSEMVQSHFCPPSILRSGLALKNVREFSKPEAMLNHSLDYCPDLNSKLEKVIGMEAESANLDISFKSGSRRFRFVSEPITFENERIVLRNVNPKFDKIEKGKIERRNKMLKEQNEVQWKHGVLMIADLMEDDPPLSIDLSEQFSDLTAIAKKLTEEFKLT
jgi:hypothetical protein